MRKFFAALLVGLMAARAGATSYVYDGTSIPFPKTDLTPLPGGADPTKYIVATDWNGLSQAVTDLRSAILGGQWYKLTDYAAAVSTAGNLVLRSQGGKLEVSQNAGAFQPISTEGRKTFNVREGCGGGTAKGDGTTDDRAAIQACVTAAAGGGRVFVPEGDYKLNGGLVIDTTSNVEIYGQGPQSKLHMRSGGWNNQLLPDGSSAAGTTKNYGMVNCYHSSNVHIHDLQLFGAKDTVAGGPSGYETSPNGIEIEECSNVWVDHTLQQNFHFNVTWSAGDWHKNTGLNFSQNVYYDAGYISPTDPIITTFHENAGATVQFNAAQSQISNNIFIHCGGAIDLTGSFLTASGNIAADILNVGVFAGDQPDMHGGLIANNIVTATFDSTHVSGGSGLPFYGVQIGTPAFPSTDTFTVEVAGNLVHVTIADNAAVTAATGQAIIAYNFTDARANVHDNTSEFSYAVPVSSVLQNDAFFVGTNGQWAHPTRVRLANNHAYARAFGWNAPAWSGGGYYASGTVTNYSGTLYKSIQGANVNHQPDVSPSWWSVYTLPTYTGNVRGFLGSPNGGSTLEVLTSGNVADGLNTAWDWFYPGGGGNVLKVTQQGDMFFDSSSGARTGLSVNSGLSGYPIYAHYDSSNGSNSGMLSPIMLHWPPASVAGDNELAWHSDGTITKGPVLRLKYQTGWTAPTINAGTYDAHSWTVPGLSLNTQCRANVAFDSLGTSQDVTMDAKVVVDDSGSGATVKVITRNLSGTNWTGGGGTLFFNFFCD